MPPASRTEYILKGYFDWQMSDGLVADTQQWLGKCGEREDVEASLKKLWDENVSYDSNPSAAAYGSLEKVCEKLGIPGGFSPEVHSGQQQLLRKPLTRRVAFRAAAVLIPLVLVAGTLYIVRYRPYERHPMVAAIGVESVTAGEKKVQAKLSDGTDVWVATHSRISYERDSERHLSLDGEAYLSVVHNEMKPFTVKTSRFDITVLGTMFDVRDVPGETQCSVSTYQGKVKVDTAVGEYTLNAGEQLVWDTKAGPPRVEKLTTTGPDWMSEPVCYMNTKLSEVFEALEKKYGVQVRLVGDTNFENAIVTLKLNSNDGLDATMEVLYNICGTFTYHKEGSTVTITGKQTD